MTMTGYSHKNNSHFIYGRASKFLYVEQMLAGSSSWYSYMDLVVFTLYYVMFNLVLCNKNIDF